MAAVATFIIDKSALARIVYPEVDRVVAPLVESGLVATCAMVEFELLWSTRSAAEFDDVRQQRGLAYEWLPIEDPDWIRALDVQQALWQAGHMRTVLFPGLIIAAVAERHRLTVLHYDADYDRFAFITGQRAEWVVPRGSIP